MFWINPSTKESIASLPSKTLTVGRNTLSYYDSDNKGVPLVLLHGVAGDKNFWRYNIPFWEQQGFRVLAFDVQGHGESSVPKRANLAEFAREIHQGLQTLDIKTYHTVGHSMGAQIAIWLAYFYPQAVQKMALLAPAGFEYFSQKNTDWLLERITPDFTFNAFTNRLMSMTYHFKQWQGGEWEWINQHHQIQFAKLKGYAEHIANCMKNMLQEPVYHILPYIETQTLVLAGTHDNLIPNFFLHQTTTAEIMKQGTNKLPNAILQLLDQTGHMVMVEQSERVNRAVSYFILL